MQKTLNVSLLDGSMKKAGLSQASLAEIIGVSREIVSKWLKGKKFPRPDKLFKMGMALGLEYDKLVIEEESPNAPIVAFRKKAHRKTLPEHIKRAQETGKLLESLVPFLPSSNDLERPPTLKKPSIDYNYLNKVCGKLRDDIGVSAEEEIKFSHLIDKFNILDAVLIPVLLGDKDKHENALHIYLPESMTAWIFINLDTNIHDFKFWMAHELGHVYAPNLKGDEGEDFADLFAQVLLFPEELAKNTYQTLTTQQTVAEKIGTALRYAKKFTISPYTVKKSVDIYAKANNLPEITFGKSFYGAITNFNKKYKPVSESIFGEELKPSAKDYIATSKKIFKTPFFDTLEQYFDDTGYSASFIQKVLQMPLTDSKALLKELRK